MHQLLTCSFCLHAPGVTLEGQIAHRPYWSRSVSHQLVVIAYTALRTRPGFGARPKS